MHLDPAQFVDQAGQLHNPCDADRQDQGSDRQGDGASKSSGEAGAKARHQADALNIAPALAKALAVPVFRGSDGSAVVRCGLGDISGCLVAQPTGLAVLALVGRKAGGSAANVSACARPMGIPSIQSGRNRATEAGECAHLGPLLCRSRNSRSPFGADEFGPDQTPVVGAEIPAHNRTFGRQVGRVTFDQRAEARGHRTLIANPLTDRRLRDAKRVSQRLLCAEVRYGSGCGFHACKYRQCAYLSQAHCLS